MLGSHIFHKPGVRIAILGQGIAGSALSHTLYKAGVSHKVFDAGLQGSSSMVAAGMWNPIVFRKLNKSWRVDTLLPFATKFYREVESLLGINILHEHSLVRLFASIEEQNNWSVRAGEEGFEKYMPPELMEHLKTQPIRQPFGHGVVSQAGRIDVPLWLRAYRSFLQSIGSIEERNVEMGEITLKEGRVEVDREQFDALIFCQGYQGTKNKWFGQLPLHPNKGEVIRIRAEGLAVNCVLNRGFFILPEGGNMYKVGATFSTKDLSLETTLEARQWLVDKLDKVIDTPYDIVDQSYGIRPTVADRKPLVGWHPQHAQLGVLNGLGAKGVSIAPSMAHMMLEGKLDGSWPEASVSRYM